MAITFTAGTSVESTASVTSTTVTLPAGLADGDYTIIVASLNASTGFITTPSGWTDILPYTNSANGSTSDTLAIFYRKWVSGDTDPVVATKSGRVAMTPIKVSGADPTTFVDVAGTVTQAASGATTIVAPSITPASTSLVCVFNGRHVSSGVYLDPWTNLSADLTKIAEANGRASTATNAGHCIANATVAASVATGTRQADPANATTGAMGVSFSLNVAAAGGSSQTATPTAIASGEAVGTPSLSSVATVTPGGVADSGGVGTPTVSTTVTVSPTGIPSALGLGSPTLSGTATVTPDGIASAEALGSPAASGQTTVSPTGIASAEALGTPALSGSTTVTPDGIASGEAVGTPALSTGMVVTPTGIPSAASLGSPTISTTATASPTGIASDAAVGTPALSQGGSAQTATPTGIPSAAAAGSPTLSASVSVQPGGIASAQAPGSPALSTQATVQPAGIPTAAAVGTPSLSFPGPAAPQTVQPTGIPSAAAAGAPVVSYWTVLRPTGIPTKQFVGQPVLLTAARVTPAGIPSGAAVGQPAMSGPGAGLFAFDLEASISKPHIKASITPQDRAAGLGSKRWKGHIG